jgi:hypothetical protein
MQQDAAINSGKILAENRRLQQELESRRDEIRRSHEKFEELARKSNIDRAKIEAEKEKVNFPCILQCYFIFQRLLRSRNHKSFPSVVS